MAANVLAELVRNPILSHLAIAAAMLAVLVPALVRIQVPGAAWHAAAYCSLYFYARESAQAERALKPLLGDPEAFFWTLWPGNWSRGGHLWEWLAPTLLAVALAAALSFRARRTV